MNKIKHVINTANELGLYPQIPIVKTAPNNPTIEIDGKKYINFASNNYLGLANHEEVKEEIINGIRKYGVGTCASRLAIGNTDAHVAFEKRISNFIGVEDAVVCASGYLANVGVFSAVMDRIFLFDHGDKNKFDYGVIFSDEKNHASIVDGARLSHAEKVVYKHNNIDDLEKKIKKYPYKRKLIVSDAVFSVDGDVALLPKLLAIKKKYNSLLMLDEAHSFGVLGKTGRGIAEHFNISAEEIDINMGTLSKALGSVGGYIAGKKVLIDFLRVTALPFVLTAGPIAPALALGAIKAIDIIDKNPHIVERLRNNVQYIIEGLEKLNISYLSKSQIVMIPVGDERRLVNIVNELKKIGILVSGMRWPAVPWGASKIRISIISPHDKGQMDMLLVALEKTKI